MKTYRLPIIIGIAILFIVFSFVLVFQVDNTISTTKEEREELKKQNKELNKQLLVAKDSIDILYKQYVLNKNRDTIYINKVVRLKDKTNEEINNIPYYSVDSNINLFTRNSEEFIRGLYKDTL